MRLGFYLGVKIHGEYNFVLNYKYIHFNKGPMDLLVYKRYVMYTVQCFCSVPRAPIITINHTVDYMGRGFMIFRRGIDITRGIGRVLLKVEPVLGPGIARALKPSPI